MKRFMLCVWVVLSFATLQACGEEEVSSINCITNNDCPLGQICSDGECKAGMTGTDGDTVEEEKPWIGECHFDEDCSLGYKCVDDFCIPEDIPDGDREAVVDGDQIITDGDTDHSGIACKDDTDCTDYLFCNGIEVCNTAGYCENGEAPCNDGIECTTDTCDEDTNHCDNTADHTICHDDDPCNGNEYCDVTAGCQSDNALDCNDNIPCTNDSCKPGVGCVNEADNSKCTSEVSCLVGTCNAVSGCTFATDDTLCDDEVDCTTETCDETNGCVYVTDDTQCADAFSCTGDYCAIGEGCKNTPDDNACTEVQLCNPTAQGANAETGCVLRDPCFSSADCDDGVACTEDICDPDRGCFNNPKASLCDDGFNCTVDVCDEVTGCSNTPDDSFCDDMRPCTVDSCSATEGCVQTPNHALCDDGLACTTETCTLQSDCVWEPHNNLCDDGIDCTADICEVGVGCRHQADDTMCSENQICDPLFGCKTRPDCTTNEDCTDNDICNGIEFCSGGKCFSDEATVLTCDDTVDCTIDSCDPVAGCVFTPDHSFCDDSDECTDNACVITEEYKGCYSQTTKDTDNDYYIDANCTGGNDCNDDNPDVHPDIEEVCDDNIDNNCDGLTDQQDDICKPCSEGCPTGYKCCAGQCQNILTSNTNCGDCDVACGTACLGGTCMPAGVCSDALNNLITSNTTLTGTTCNASDSFNAKNKCDGASSNGDGKDHVYAIKQIAGNEMRITLTTTGTDADDGAIYYLSDCYDINTCVDYSWTSTDDYDAYITPGSSNGGEIIYVVVDFKYGGCGSYSLKVDYDYEPSSCESTGSAHYKFFAAFILMLLGWTFMARRRKNSNELD